MKFSLPEIICSMFGHKRGYVFGKFVFSVLGVLEVTHCTRCSCVVLMKERKKPMPKIEQATEYIDKSEVGNNG